MYMEENKSMEQYLKEIKEAVLHLANIYEVKGVTIYIDDASQILIGSKCLLSKEDIRVSIDY